MDSGEWEVKKEYQVPGGYDKSHYATEYIHANAADGRKIPISLAYKKGLKKDGQNPTLLYGYGAYGASSDAAFNLSLFSLLDRGFVFAIAHVRGGSEMGRSWYDEGRLFNKKNSFTDFIACAEHLIQEGFTSPEKLAGTGGSAGGLLVGASMVMRPDLFKAVVCKVPFVDVITSMSDPSIPLTTLEYDQWGNPDNKDEYDTCCPTLHTTIFGKWNIRTCCCRRASMIHAWHIGSPPNSSQGCEIKKMTITSPCSKQTSAQDTQVPADDTTSSKKTCLISRS
jgi:oligopeptidase B